MKILRFLYSIRSACRRICRLAMYMSACTRGIIKRNYKTAGLLILAILIFSFIGFPALSSSKIQKNSGESPSGIIYATKAEILDSNKNPIADIYKKISEKDNDWATVNNGEYVRVTFAERLFVQNNILLYARKSGRNLDGQNPKIQAYASDTGQLVATFPLINNKDTYKASLAGLKTPTDSFDLKIIGGSADIDWIVDPSYVFNLLKSFTGGGSDGVHPFCDLTLSGSTLYGTTHSGGSSDQGTIFSIDVSGSGFTLLHSFAGGSSDGSYPSTNLTLSGSMLYGAAGGGSSNQGTIFSINTSGSGFTLLHSFAGGSSDGTGPYGSLSISGSTLYGTTSSGGSSDQGTIFSIDVSGSGFTLLHSFAGGSSDGANPHGLTLSGSTLYGVTFDGGSSGTGTIFSIDVSGSGFTLLHSFAGGSSDGSRPSGSLSISGSTLYGTTEHGGSSDQGTIFSIDVSGSGFTLLHSFASGSSDGANPYGSLSISGSTLYGMTYYGGSSGAGTIFSIDVSGSGFTLLHSFAGGSSDGANPHGLTLSGSTLYGVTAVGGSSNDGIIFNLELPVPIIPLPPNTSGKIGAITPSLDCTTDNCAWSDNAGWVNFTPTDSSGNYLGLRITDGAVIGYAWSQNYGWINFGPTPYISVTNTISGVLSGSAWGQNAGWIDFTGVFIDPDTGLFSGMATGDSDKIGTINFNTTGPNACSLSDPTICKVVTDWKPETITFSVSNPFVNFGIFSSSGPRYATAGGAGSSSDSADAGILHISVHGSSGYSISVIGSTLTNTSPSHNTISTAGTIDSGTGLLIPAASASGTNQFGIRLIKNTGTYPGTESYVTDPYATSDWALNFSEPNNQVAGGDGDDTAEFGLRYICNVAPNTPAGYYLANLVFAITPNF